MAFSWIAFPSILTTLLAAALGFFVLSRRYTSPTHRFFAAGMGVLCIMELGNTLALLHLTETAYLFWKRISLVGEVFMLPTWIGFSLIFYRVHSEQILARWRIPLIGIFLASTGFASSLSSDAFLGLLPSGGSSADLLKLGSIGYLFYIYLTLGSVFILVQLESTFRSLSEPQRWSTKFLLIGVGLLFAFSLYSGSQSLLFSNLFTRLIPIQSLIILTALLMITFSLVRHRNLEVDVFISRHIVYGSAIVVTSGLYLLAVAFLTKIISSYSNQISPFLIPLLVFLSLAGFIVLLSSGQIRRRLRLFISEHFYKHKYDFHRTWMEVTEQLGPRRTVKELITVLSEFLREKIGAQDVSVWLYDQNKRQFLRDTLSRPAHPGFVEWMEGHDSPIAAGDLPGSLELGGVKDVFGETKILVPLTAVDALVGFMTVGPDITGKEYVQNDHDLLRAVGKQAAYQLLNARLADDLATAKQLEGFHEMSTFVIHELKNLTHTLSLMAQNATVHFDKPEFRTEALKTLQQIVAKLTGFTSRLSGFSQVFSLNRNEVNLNELIRKVLASLEGAIKAEVTEDLLPLPPLKVDEKQIGEAIVNILLNAEEAVGMGGRIRIETRRDEDWAVLSITDNGRGMSPSFIHDQLFKPFRTTKSQGLGIGLFQTKKIIEAHGGSIEAKSREGKGTSFDIRLPL